MSLGEQIRNQRKARGWTQQALAHALHRKRTTILAYEHGVITPPLAIVRRLALLFECPMALLLGEEPEPAPTLRDPDP